MKKEELENSVQSMFLPSVTQVVIFTILHLVALFGIPYAISLFFK